MYELLWLSGFCTLLLIFALPETVSFSAWTFRFWEDLGAKPDVSDFTLSYHSQVKTSFTVELSVFVLSLATPPTPPSSSSTTWARPLSSTYRLLFSVHS